MNEKLFKAFHADGHITDIELDQVLKHKQRPIVLDWDLKTLLYIGILILTTGLGIIVYKNIDSIGHLAIVIFIAAAAGACFAYCFSKAQSFKKGKVSSPNVLFDYILLLGCMLLLVFIGYLQFQYNVFGHRWGLATFIPMVLLFFCAYYFDHLGVLSLAIVNLAAWFGISVTPMHLLNENDFNSDRIIYTGILLGILLIVLSIFSLRTNFKKHFAFTYKNFGTHLLFIATLSALFNFDSNYLLWFLVLALIALYQFYAALQKRSFYFLVSATLYFYVGFSYIINRALLYTGSYGEGGLYLLLLYYIFSSAGLIYFLIRYNKILKRHDSLQ